MDTENRSPILRYTLDYLPQVLVEETDGEATRDLYGLDLAAQSGSTTTTYLGYDALNVRLHQDEDGGLTAAYRYGPFGEELGTVPEGYAFAGERWDEPVGLLYLRARYYNPVVGRFVSRDRWGGESQFPQSLDRFVYVANNVVNRVDPSGLRGKMPWGAFLNNMFNLPPYCSNEWHGILDLGNPGVRSIIESNFGGAGDVQPYIVCWKNYGEDYQECYDLNLYDIEISGWVDLFNEILIDQSEAWYGHRINPSLIKAMAMQETKIGADSTNPSEGIMQVIAATQGDLAAKEKVKPFYFGTCQGIDWDNSLGIAAGARVFFWIYQGWPGVKGNLWESVRQYNGSGPDAELHRERVRSIFQHHRYLWTMEDECPVGCSTCVGPRCEEGTTTHRQPHRWGGGGPPQE